MIAWRMTVISHNPIRVAFVPLGTRREVARARMLATMNETKGLGCSPVCQLGTSVRGLGTKVEVRSAGFRERPSSG